MPVSPESTKKKVRKRRAYNRTGFPTVKRKKKKTLSVESAEKSLEGSTEVDHTPVCDRVPKEGKFFFFLFIFTCLEIVLFGLYCPKLHLSRKYEGNDRIMLLIP